MTKLKRNSQIVLDLLASEVSGLTRSDLGDHTGLSKPTVQSIVSELETAGFIAPTDEQHPPSHNGASVTGRRAQRFVLARNAGLVVGVDLGHHHIRVAIADRSGNPLGESLENIEVDVDEEGASVLTLVVALIAKALTKNNASIESVRAIGVGLPTAVDDSGLVLFADYLPTWATVDVADELRTLLNNEYPGAELDSLTIRVENDANLGALGEGLKGAAQDSQNYLYVKMSTGVGMGLILDGQLYRGTNGAAGEVGHVTVSSSAEPLIKSVIAKPLDPCPRCTKIDCLENLASCRAIVRQLRATDDRYAQDLRIEDVIQRAVNDVINHKFCMQAVVDAGIRLGYTLIDIVRVYAPDTVVIGGLLAQAGDALIKPIDTALKGAKGVPPVKVSVVNPKRITHSEVDGAIALALQHVPPATSAQRRRPRLLAQ